MITNPLSFILDIALQLKGIYNVLYTFLFTEIQIPLSDIKVSLWLILGGVGLVAILIVRVVKMFI